MVELNKAEIKRISQDFGDSFYVLDTDRFEQNYDELLSAFRSIYPKSNIAYSYKTNYIPRLCSIVDEKGGYAEIVSSMEYQIAKKLGVEPSRIIFNGPYKDTWAVEEILLAGGSVNIDSASDFLKVKQIAEKNPDKEIRISIRCNFDICDGCLSRFGVDVDSEGFTDILSDIKTINNINLHGMHCHFASRDLTWWPLRAEKMLDIVDKYTDISRIEHIDLGGGLFGKMHDSLKAQFSSYIPSYSEYANAVASIFAEKFKDADHCPELLIEPGSALAGDVMRFVSKVVGIKDVRGKKIATLLGSIYNINPTLNKKNPPIEIVHMGCNSEYCEDLDFGGFTCIESDYLYRGFRGELAEGDYVIFSNVGSYSVVLKPPFILPNFAVVEIVDDGLREIKSAEVFDDLFRTYSFER